MDYLWNSLEIITGYLKIETSLVRSAAVYGNTGLKGEKRIIDICRLENADTYVNASGGRALYEPAHFAAQNISLRFLETETITYQQSGPEFHPALSVIDVLMLNPQTKVQSMLGGYGLRA